MVVQTWIQALPTPLASRPDGQRWRTRFAPAPTGWLHLGHLVNAIHVWGLARSRGGDVVLRLEDHDRTRCRLEFEVGLLADLEWLGLEPDQFDVASFRADPNGHPARQSNQDARYERELEHLATRSLIYPCVCSRRDIAHRVPHLEGEEPRYPGTCRMARIDPKVTSARRFIVPPDMVAFHDLRLGWQEQRPAQQCGDFLLRDRHDHWTYQYAVVVDDLVHDIDVVIRGEDLLASTGRQLMLARALERERMPVFLHHALLVNPDGRKLSKSHGDTGIREMRAAGWSREALFGMAAHHAGLQNDTRPLSLDDVAALFAP